MGKKRKKGVQFHQHRDINGNIFGKSHPVEIIHNNVITQLKHKITLLMGKREKINKLNVGDYRAEKERRRKGFPIT
uniref:Uncharacterized protein n=1 Tax=viral metagenome TaxID=1070528 RepID=A0A6M3L235_9ZZZZ